MHPYVDILLWLERLCLLVTLLYFKRLKRDGLVFIPILLLVIVLTETVGLLIMNKVITVFNSRFWFNLMMPVQFICLLLLFLNKSRFRYWKRVIVFFCGVIVALTLIYLLLYRNEKFNTLNYTIESVFVSACCLHYLFECMNSASIADVTRDTLLYLSLGTLLFYLGTLPLYSMYNYLYSTHKNIFFAYYKLGFILNYAMYILISFGILWTKKK